MYFCWMETRIHSTHPYFNNNSISIITPISQMKELREVRKLAQDHVVRIWQLVCGWLMLDTGSQT